MAEAESQFASTPDVVSIAKAVGDGLRAAILRALASDSFGVLELGQIFAMAQPAISHHLKLLHQAGLVDKRREGTSIFYRRHVSGLDKLRAAIYAAIDDEPLAADVVTRIAAVHAQRSERSLAFFESSADALASQRTLICSPDVYAPNVLEAWQQASGPATGLRALEVGPGRGEMLSILAPHFAEVVAVDSSATVLADAREQLATSGINNVILEQADFNRLRLHATEAPFHLIVAAMVVHHMAQPPGFFRQAQRLLAPGGVLVVAELCPHDHEWARKTCGDQWLGFASDDLDTWAQDASFTCVSREYLAQNNGFRIQVVCYRLATQPRRSPGKTGRDDKAAFSLEDITTETTNHPHPGTDPRDPKGNPHD